MKIYPINFESISARFKTISVKVTPLIISGIGILILLAIQVLAVGLTDYLGISPKISFLTTSISYVSIFSGLTLLSLGLAVFNHVRKKEKAVGYSKQDSGAVSFNEPVCKILIIKKTEVVTR
jgi:hypothetical protein